MRVGMVKASHDGLRPMHILLPIVLLFVLIEAASKHNSKVHKNPLCCLVP